MLIVQGRFLLFDAWQIWWPESCDDVLPLLARSPVVTVMQCGAQVEAALTPHAFRRKPFHTLTIDLSRSEKDLWSRLDPRSCRQPIKRAREIGCSVSVNEDGLEALDFINRFIQKRNYAPPVSTAQWQRYLQYGTVFTARHQGRLLAAHLLLVDRPCRVRLLLGATARLEQGVPATLMGGVNRYLHWFEFIHYKAEGMSSYDFGGLELDQSSPLYSISRFKLSFGGEIIRQSNLRLAANRSLRLGLRGLAWAKELGSKVRAYQTLKPSRAQSDRAVI